MASAAAVSPAAAVVGARRDERATTTRRCGDDELRRRAAVVSFVLSSRALHAKSTRDVRDSAALNPQRWLCWCRRARKTSVEGANAANNTYVAAIEWV